MIYNTEGKKNEHVNMCPCPYSVDNKEQKGAPPKIFTVTESQNHRINGLGLEGTQILPCSNPSAMQHHLPRSGCSNPYPI